MSFSNTSRRKMTRRTKEISSLWKSLLSGILVYAILFSNQRHSGNQGKSHFKVIAAPASPNRFQNPQPDGTLTPELEIKGSPAKHVVTDIEGFTVIEEEDTGTFVYAKKNESTGELVSSGIIVGGANVTELVNMTERMVEPSEEVQKKRCGRYCKDENDDFDNKLKFQIGGLTINNGDGKAKRRTQLNITCSDELREGDGEIECGDVEDEQNILPCRNLQSTRKFSEGTVRNLVVLVKFADHKDRELPSLGDFNLLFNSKGGHPDIAPTGSVRDVFLTSSYNKVNLISTIVGWVKLPRTEAYYADETSGSTDKFEEVLQYSLEVLDNVPSFSFSQFDKDEDGVIDSLVFIHSGYGAEWGQVDCEGQKAKDRIWSHQWKIDPVYTSKDGFIGKQYFTASALWGSCGSDIARIGTISHELGHVFGLPDLYLGGSGIGSHGLMGNSWGFDGSQLYPPILSPWCKIMMDWIKPTMLKTPGRYTLHPIESNEQVFKIQKGFPRNEYLLIENRQPIGFDAKLPKGGLAIYHVDEYASFYKNPGYPEQGDWPENGNHYRVALVQPDGKFHLEKGENRGDSSDLFVDGDTLGPGPGVYPNSDSYQGGLIRETGIRLYDIVQDEFDQSISFSLDINGETPVSAPTPSQPLVPNELMTNYNGETGARGVMFDIKTGPNSILIFNLDIHVRENPDNPSANVPIKVFTKEESYFGYESNRAAWKEICSTTVVPAGFYKRTTISNEDFEAVTIDAGKTQAFYVSLSSPDLRYSRGVGLSKVVAANSDLQIFEGTGFNQEFGISNYSPRVFNGFVKYHVIESENTEPLSASTINEERNELITNFAGNNGHYGIMFDIHAKGSSVTVTGMDLNIRNEESIPVEIWTKPGNYKGHERDGLAWEIVCEVQVISKGLGQKTTIFANDFKPVQIYKGDSQAFYVSTKNRGDLRYNSPGKNLPTSDANIEISLGSGLSYPFGYGSSKLYSPREFSGTIKYTASKMSGVSAVNEKLKEILTTFGGENGSYGVMFDIKAKRDLFLQNFDFHTRAQGEIKVEAYTISGSHVDYMTDLSAWTKLCDATVTGRGSYQRTGLEDDCFVPIPVMKDQIQGIFITLTSLDLRYTDDETMDVNDVFKENDDIEVKVGTGIGNYPLGTTLFPGRIFNGVVKYEVGEDLKENRQLQTTLKGGNKNYGILFSIEAKESIAIESVDFHTQSTEKISVQVWSRKGPFEGYVHSMDGWQNVADVDDVDGLGEGSITVIDPSDFQTLYIEKGEKQSFYISLDSSNLIYTNGSGSGNNEIINSNYDMTVRGGIGIGSSHLIKLGNTYFPRLFNGKINYSLISTR